MCVDRGHLRVGVTRLSAEKSGEILYLATHLAPGLATAAVAVIRNTQVQGGRLRRASLQFHDAARVRDAAAADAVERRSHENWLERHHRQAALSEVLSLAAMTRHVRAAQTESVRRARAEEAEAAAALELAARTAARRAAGWGVAAEPMGPTFLTCTTSPRNGDAALDEPPRTPSPADMTSTPRNVRMRRASCLTAAAMALAAAGRRRRRASAAAATATASAAQAPATLLADIDAVNAGSGLAHGGLGDHRVHRTITNDVRPGAGSAGEVMMCLRLRAQLDALRSLDSSLQALDCALAAMRMERRLLGLTAVHHRFLRVAHAACISEDRKSVV